MHQYNSLKILLFFKFAYIFKEASEELNNRLNKGKVKFMMNRLILPLLIVLNSCNLFKSELTAEKTSPSTSTTKTTPAGISAALNSTSAKITFPTFPNATSYKVYFNTTANVTSTSANFTCNDPATCQQPNLTCNSTYYFKYAVVLADSELPPSADTATLTISCPTSTPNSATIPDPLTVVSTSPATAAVSQNPATTISIIFNAIDPNTVTSASIQVKRNSNSTLVAGTVTADNKSITFSPLGALFQNESYTVTLIAANFTNKSLQHLSANYSWSFTTNSVTALAGRGSVHLEWPTIASAVGYKIFRSQTSPVSTAGTYLSYTVNTEFHDSTADNLAPSYYRIVPFDGSVDIAGQLTSEISAQASIARPGVPKTLGASCGESNQVSLTWLAPIEGATPASYVVYRSTSGIPKSTDVLTTTTTPNYTDNSVTNGVVYYYRISALSASNLQGALSESATSCPVASNAVSASLIFVDNAAPGGGSGSYSSPLNLLQTAIGTVSAGGTIVLKPGTYGIGAANSVTTSYYVRSVTGTYTNSGVTLSPPTSTIQSAFSIPVGGITNFGLTGMNFTGFGDGTTALSGVLSIANSSAVNNLLVQNNNMDTNLVMGIYSTRTGFARGLNWRIIGNRVNSATGNASVSCMRVYYFEYSTVSDNILSNCNYGGLLLNELYNSTVSRNTISSTIRSGISVGTALGNGFAISHNKISSTNTGNTATYGAIRMSDIASGQAWISYNLMGSSLEGFTLYTTTATLAGSLKLRSNEISGNSSKGINNLSTQSVTIDADANYFGCAAGPGQAGCDTVSTFVNVGTPQVASPL